MSEIGKLIQAYQDKHGTSDRALALRVGVTATLVGRWKHGTFVELPKPEKVSNLADQLSLSEDVVLDAFLTDTGYKREDVMGNAEHPAATKAPDVGPADQPTVTPLRRGEKINKTVTTVSAEGSNVSPPPQRVASRPKPRKRRD